MVPVAVLISSSRLMPVLEAREALEEVDRVGIGTGSMPKELATRRVTDWRIEAGLMPAERPAPKRVTAESLERLSRTGYALVKVPKVTKPHGG